MNLAFESGLEIANATEDDIRAYLEGEVFSILRLAPDTYLQCHVKFPWPSYGSSDFKRSWPGQGWKRKIARLPFNSRIWPSQGYHLEYQDGALTEHFRATDFVQARDYLITLEMVTSCFCKYLAGDESWRTDFHWEKVDLAELEPTAGED